MNLNAEEADKIRMCYIGCVELSLALAFSLLFCAVGWPDFQRIICLHDSC